MIQSVHLYLIFCEKALNKLDSDRDFLSEIMLTDEANFYGNREVSCYVTGMILTCGL